MRLIDLIGECWTNDLLLAITFTGCVAVELCILILAASLLRGRE